MRKFISILLICLLLFNALGFYGFITAVNSHYYQGLIESFDSETYDEQETFIIEVPHSFPYAVEQPNFMRVDGEIKYKGEFYKMVKKRISFDSIFVMVVKDRMKNRTQKALTDYWDSLTNKQSGDKPAGKIAIHFNKEYYGCSFSITTLSLGWVKNLSKGSKAPVHYSSFFSPSVFTPPEIA